MVRNVTDIDDKILRKAAEHGRPWWEWAATHERAFSAAYTALGCLPPSIEPRATGHVTQMTELIERLIERGHAYAAGGDVYFAVRTFPEYGALSGQKVDDVAQGEGEAAGKRDPLDFTLWKAAKPGEPSWPTPWGAGRPGWHLECSAMATAYLGPEFDIHGGGLDLVFPHHENEQAQSHAAGDGFARYWLHNAWVTMGGEKMSKSLGNTLAIEALLGRVRGVELRYYLVGPHYRSAIEYSDAALDESVSAYRRIEAFVNRVRERHGVPEAAADVPAEFAAAMDDDLGTPGALAVVHNAVREGNTALDAGDAAAASRSASCVRAMTGLLGWDPLAPSAPTPVPTTRPGRPCLAGRGDAGAAPAGPGGARLRDRGPAARRAARRRCRRRGRRGRFHLVAQGLLGPHRPPLRRSEVHDSWPATPSVAEPSARKARRRAPSPGPVGSPAAR
ncbi:hypothetical protein L7F22_030607 [Adiantum nelumboides]|nr:hypothetical protein [Adiantum nelumboides]